MALPREEEQRLFEMLSWKEALALVGPRRVGKSTLAVRMLEAWEQRGGSGAYFDLEALDAPATALELSKAAVEVPKKGLLVLDEVQALDGWVKFARQEIEQNRHHLVLTGSSASLLSKEIASSLAGRAIPETILPLSYRDARAWGLKTLDDYLDVGGYPECVLRPLDAPKLHKVYLELAVLRDVAARLKARQTKPLSDLALILLSEPGKTISAKKTAAAIGTSQPTFRQFVQALNDAFLVLSVPPFLHSPRQAVIADAKHYAYDTGLQKSASISTSEDAGRRLENLAAIELLRRGHSISYYRAKNGAECDFIAKKPGTQTLAVQVFSGEGRLPQRELEGLEAGTKASRGTGLLLCKSASAIPENGLPKNTRAKTIEEWLYKKNTD